MYINILEEILSLEHLMTLINFERLHAKFANVFLLFVDHFMIFQSYNANENLLAIPTKLNHLCLHVDWLNMNVFWEYRSHINGTSPS